jgi:hypothetical protein
MLSTNSLFETGRQYYLKPAAGILRAFETITILRMGIHESLFRYMVETILFSQSSIEYHCNNTAAAKLI